MKKVLGIKHAVITSFVCLLALVQVLTSCDSDSHDIIVDAEEVKKSQTILLGNTTADSLVMVFENRTEASMLYYHFYDEIENDNSYVKDVDSDTSVPFWNETDQEGRYLHWEVLAPYTLKDALPGILVAWDLNKKRFYSLPPERLKPFMYVHIGVVRYPDFEKYDHRKDELQQAHAIEHYNYNMWQYNKYGGRPMFIYQEGLDIIARP